jgi:carboxymethylenebutenolidase
VPEGEGPWPGLTMVAAGGVGDKMAAAASFHAGRVALPGDPNSPHLAADKIRAAVFVAGSIEDDGDTLRQKPDAG